MLRYGSLLLCAGLFLTFAVLEVSPASAACSGGTQSVFCFSSNLEMNPTEGLGSLTLTLLAARVGGAKIKIHCAKGSGKGTFVALGASKGEVEFSNCTVIEPTGCTISQPIKAVFTGKLSTGTMPATDVVAGAGTGGTNEEFTAITIGTCSIAGTYPVTGLQTIEIPSGESSASEHEFVATKANSNLKIGLETATFSSKAKVHLTAGGEWLIMLGV